MNKKTFEKSSFLFLSVLMFASLILLSCEDYEEKEFELSDLDAQACAILTDTMSISVTAGDLRELGPQWNDDQITVVLAGNERIGDSWYDIDRVIEPDVFVIASGADTIAAMTILSFIDVDGSEVDSIELAYKYNPAGTADFTGLIADTILIESSETNTAYIQFATGAVGSSADWDISIEGPVIALGVERVVHRLEDTALSGLNAAPVGVFYADGLGFTTAFDFLETDNFILSEFDSLLRVSFGEENSAYFLFDWQGGASSRVTFYLSNYLDVTLWDAVGSELLTTSESLDMATIAYCPDILKRESIVLDDGIYLAQFKPDESMTSTGFRLAVLEGE